MSEVGPLVGDSIHSWWVPLSFTDGNEKDFSDNNTLAELWLSPNKSSVTKRIRSDENSWIIGNVQATGYYRVNYDERNWKLITDQLRSNHRAIHVINRAHLIDDAFALASNQIIPYTTPFSLIEYLVKEEEYVPWASAIQALTYVGRMFSSTPYYGRYRVTY